MPLVGDDERRPRIALVAFHQIVDVAHHGDVGDGELIFVAFAGKHAHLEDRDVRRGPWLAGAVEELSCQPRAEERHAVAHLERPIAPVLGQSCIAADAGQRRDHIAGQHLFTPFLGHCLCRKKNGIADQQAIGPSHARADWD